jgi:hypothetical protein
MMNTRCLTLGLALALGACSSDPKPPAADHEDVVDAGTPDEHTSPDPQEASASQHPNLQWKRYAAFEADLAQALELAPDELCKEFGQESCTRVVHLAPLGGHEPFKTGLLEPSAEPLATTPAVVDRIVLSACSKRAGRDRAAGAKAKVFRAIDLGKAAPPPDSAETKTLVSELYRRFLARDPDEFELASVATLALDEEGKALGGDAFAALACFTIATSTEFLFF